MSNDTYTWIGKFAVWFGGAYCVLSLSIRLYAWAFVIRDFKRRHRNKNNQPKT